MLPRKGTRSVVLCAAAGEGQDQFSSCLPYVSSGGGSSPSPKDLMVDGVGVSISCSEELEQCRKLALVMTMKENWQIDQPRSRAEVSSPQDPFRL